MVVILYFTQIAISKIKPPKEKRDVYRDTKDKGLFLEVLYGGTKTLYLGITIKGVYRKIKLGNFPNISVNYARKKTLILKGQIAKGIDPLKTKNASTLKEVYDLYINHRKLKDSSKILYKGIMNKYLKNLHYIHVSNIRKEDIYKIFNNAKKGGKYSANKTLKLIKAILNIAVELELIEKNPANGIKIHKMQARDRYITLEEMPRFLAAVEEDKNPYLKYFVYISLYTAARRNNVLSMRWENIRLEEGVWYIPETKNGESQTVPLINLLIEKLKQYSYSSESEWVFPGQRRNSGHLTSINVAWKRVCKRAGLKNLRIHDLRRTVGSWMAKFGMPIAVISKLLNHNDHQSTKFYIHLNTNVVRDAIQKFANEIAKCTNLRD
ncbi:putative integrase [Orientia tsutsugamushi str. Ikeda]|uniref:Putative integrase n=2 Tax=Orientia tsutsugamushi (strain Ikeda) TaxID=334380 RepID=B3CTI8_ORITI|nr:site-specific integrase [Orientia tsutsugamushi]BAG40685.1 putative integrase [Orientia tsutsugamushi str. Ikeda]BAG41360.1 putative integrase [Orientia tsutsugamushi str. Ikeda]